MGLLVGGLFFVVYIGNLLVGLYIDFRAHHVSTPTHVDNETSHNTIMPLTMALLPLNTSQKSPVTYPFLVYYPSRGM